jgi:hypothetical protein
MQLKPTAPTLDYPYLHCVSHNNLWAIGVYSLISGFAVGCSCDEERIHGGYACGNNKELAMHVWSLLARILLCVDESISIAQMSALLPNWERRPIDKDDCYPRLIALAEELEAQNHDPVVLFDPIAGSITDSQLTQICKQSPG